ncbi:hypothetical protein [Pedobacter psychroterrae]|uniref:Restriction endonuclease n=1 Tax=Pedobacter psychroterrae TaxID=2530453 RepID=A0A4R0NBX9_9SPHI|nr:hypothetical protein [Pedobacter psychroterrae]TCC96793.1 hypothetical protein EZ437_20595 [Pedobacter psychroterrae]
MEYTKDHIILEYKRLKEYLGKSPSSRKFYAETGLSLRMLEKLYGSNAFSKLVNECGDVANNFSTDKIEIEDILLQWGNLTRECKKLPAIADWQFNNCKPQITNIKKSHGLRWADIPYKFLELFSDKNEWQDVVAIIPNRSPNEVTTSKNIPKIEGLPYEILKFIPPVVQDLVDQSSDKEKALEFEKGVNLVFQMLGFEVTNYGQGTGRNPDGIAKASQNNYAVLVDAKSRTENYKIGTDDRTFIEYINKFYEPLKKSGFKNIYLLIVSSGFDLVTASAIKNIKIDTQVSTTFLTSKLLLKLLSNKIKNPRQFDLKLFQELLIEDGEITEKRIDALIAKQNKS